MSPFPSIDLSQPTRPPLPPPPLPPTILHPPPQAFTPMGYVTGTKLFGWSLTPTCSRPRLPPEVHQSHSLLPDGPLWHHGAASLALPWPPLRSLLSGGRRAAQLPVPFHLLRVCAHPFTCLCESFAPRGIDMGLRRRLRRACSFMEGRQRGVGGRGEDLLL